MAGDRAARCRIATPVSHLFWERGAAEALADASDCLELREAGLPDGFSRAKPLLYHCEQSLLRPLDREALWGFIDRFVNGRRLEVVSFHAPSRYEEPCIRDGMFRPGGRRMEREEMLENARRNVEMLRSELSPEVRIAVENNNRYPTPAYDIVTDATFLRELTKTTGIDLLLDLPHASISAHTEGVASGDYLRSLPLDRVVQIHASGYSTAGEVWRDTHEHPTDEQWLELQSFVAELPAVGYLTVEYYRDPELLLALLRRARNMSTAEPEP